MHAEEESNFALWSVSRLHNLRLLTTNGERAYNRTP